MKSFPQQQMYIMGKYGNQWFFITYYAFLLYFLLLQHLVLITILPSTGRHS